MESENPKSGGYGTWIIGLMLVAYLATSFDYRQLSFQSSLVKVGSTKLSKEQILAAMRVHFARRQLSLLGAMQKIGDRDLVRSIIADEIWDQEARAMGIEVSQNAAKQSLQQRMSFLDASGRVHVKNLRNFYEKHPDFFQFDVQFEAGQAAFWMNDDILGAKLFRGQSELLDPEDRFDENKMASFLRNQGVSLLQMIAAEQKSLRIRILQNSLVKNALLPDFYKELAHKGHQQVRTWRSRFFPIQPMGSHDLTVSETMVDHFLKNNITNGMRYSPEMRTFSVMVVPSDAGMDTASVEKNKTDIEDAIGGGQHLEGIAQSKGWICGTIKSAPSGQAMDFSPALWHQNNGQSLGLSPDVCGEVLQRVFLGGKEVYRLPIKNGDLWVQVHQIHPARLFNEEELRAVAQYALKKQMNSQMTKSQAVEFANQLEGKGGAARGKKTSRHKELNMTTHVLRARDWMDKTAMQGMDPEVVMGVFEMNSSQKVALIPNQGGYTVVQLLNIRSEKQDKVWQSDIDFNSQWQWCSMFLVSYFDALEKKYDQSFDEDELNQWLEQIFQRHPGA